ncbi:MAG: 2OG-Fe(II) oxygenase [Saprospiraceae bacterium]|nr:2OG-Fe(II) oxygenase [Saprospiraceae bacterium]
MNDPFSILIDSFIENKVGLVENFISGSLATHLKVNLEELFSAQKFQLAGTGNALDITHNKLVRSDLIYWLDKAHNNAAEDAFFQLMEEFIRYLNSTCYTGITDYEFHYALYPMGTFYKKHKDQFQNNRSRQFSMIVYLNSNWKEADGGELCIHHVNHLQRIRPINRTAVFFKSSELEHEVLLTNVPRMSITGWLKTNV